MQQNVSNPKARNPISREDFLPLVIGANEISGIGEYRGTSGRNLSLNLKSPCSALCLIALRKMASAIIPPSMIFSFSSILMGKGAALPVS
jgi:hypothetical protein